MSTSAPTSDHCAIVSRGGRQETNDDASSSPWASLHHFVKGQFCEEEEGMKAKQRTGFPSALFPCSLSSGVREVMFMSVVLKLSVVDFSPL